MAKSEQSNEALNLLGTIVMFVILAAVAIFLVTGAINVINTKIGEANNMINNVASMELNRYDNKVGKGSDVLALLEQYKGSDFGVYVITGADTGKSYLSEITNAPKPASGSTYSIAEFVANGKKNLNFEPTTNKTASTYVNPDEPFQFNLIKNGNGVDIGVRAEQVKRN